ncbi:uncharacterized protein LOC105698177 [Orussus abietinus]|uniref:uncharacterized protein LOC105698177 n=1 Tax=Orussus abietinus TaxID=222816 RepID=UPI000626D963|nr:uncharacterized protein LOC105698177 [Orussus abietinus]
MFQQRQWYFSRLTKSYPVLKLFDVYDRQSFIRQYVLDNIFVCILMYILFYAALWYANKVIRWIEKSNREVLASVEENRSKLDDVIALKNKRAEYEEVVVKAKGAQKVTARHLDNEIKRLNTELAATANKMAELEKVLGKCKFWENSPREPTGIVISRECKSLEGGEGASDLFADVKILEPSFPPPTPPEPPPRKYGIFVSRPPGHRPTPSTPATGYSALSPKIGFK